MQRVRFPGATGAQLSGWFHPAESKPRGALLLSHCFTCSKDLPLYRRLASGLGQRGLSVFRFDFTGIGQSEGEFSQTTLDTNIEEIGLATSELARLAGSLPLGAIGHSLGGTATLLAARRHPELRALAIIAAAAEPSSLERRLGSRVREQAQREGVAQVEIGGRPLRIGLPLLDSLRDRGVEAELAGLSQPTLFLHGTADRIVSIEQGERLFAAAVQPKGFEPLAGADHLLSEEPQVAWAVELLWLWFDRHL